MKSDRIIEKFSSANTKWSKEIRKASLFAISIVEIALTEKKAIEERSKERMRNNDKKY